jgi:putative transposase
VQTSGSLRDKPEGEEVVEVLNGLIAQRGTPGSIRVDNGTEFTSVVLDQ